MDVAGAEKFFQVQGFTYYGCLYAHGSLPSSSPEHGTRRRGAAGTNRQNTGGMGATTLNVNTTTMVPAADRQAEDRESMPGSASPQGRTLTSTVAFIDQKCLHMLPFYDWYAFREDIQDRYNH